MKSIFGLAALATVGIAASAAAQSPVVVPVPSATAQAPAAPAQAAPPGAAPARLHISEGTEMRIRIDDRLSSGNNVDGDTFAITLVEPVTVDGVTIPSGYHGKGEVVQAKKKGMMGQGGELNIKLDYLRIGDTRVHLRGQKGGEGDGAMGATVALTVLFGPLGLLKHGHDMTINKGQELTAYVDQDVNLDGGLPKPPLDD
jgi:hypothetical protein